MQIGNLNNPYLIINFQAATAIKGFLKVSIFNIVISRYRNGGCNQNENKADYEKSYNPSMLFLPSSMPISSHPLKPLSFI